MEIQFLESALRMPLFTLPVRTSVLRIGSRVILHSPGSQLTRTQLESIGGVTDIVAPNLYHLGGVPGAAAVFPEAKLWAPKGARKKRPDIGWTDELSLAHWNLQDELPLLTLEGMPALKETVFLHKESRTLLVGDLCFNLVNARGFAARLILSLFGTYQKFAVSRLFLKAVQDRHAFERSLIQLLAWDFEDIVVGHGTIVRGEARRRLIAALQERGLALSVT